MDEFHRMNYWDSHRADLLREAEQSRLGPASPDRPAARRALLVMAVILIGILAWWIH